MTTDRSTTMNERFRELRSLLHTSPSEQAFTELRRFLDDALRVDRAEAAEKLVPYATSILARWPDSVRRIPSSWLDFQARRIPWHVLELCGLTRTLHISNQSLSNPRLHALLDSPLCESITAIELVNVGLDAAILRSLLEHPVMQRVNALDISGNQLYADSYNLLADHPTSANLRKLTLRRMHTLHGFEKLTRSQTLTGLTEIDISHPKRSREAASYILDETSSLIHLESIGLQNAWLNARNLRALENSTVAPKLRKLDLRENYIRGDKVALVLDALDAQNIRWLDVSKNPLWLEGAAVIAEARSLANLEVLRLNGCKLNADALDLLATSPVLPIHIKEDFASRRDRYIESLS